MSGSSDEVAVPSGEPTEGNNFTESSQTDPPKPSETSRMHVRVFEKGKEIVSDLKTNENAQKLAKESRLVVQEAKQNEDLQDLGGRGVQLMKNNVEASVSLYNQLSESEATALLKEDIAKLKESLNSAIDSLDKEEIAHRIEAKTKELEERSIIFKSILEGSKQVAADLGSSESFKLLAKDGSVMFEETSNEVTVLYKRGLDSVQKMRSEDMSPEERKLLLAQILQEAKDTCLRCANATAARNVMGATVQLLRDIKSHNVIENAVRKGLQAKEMAGANAEEWRDEAFVKGATALTAVQSRLEDDEECQEIIEEGLKLVEAFANNQDTDVNVVLSNIGESSSRLLDRIIEGSEHQEFIQQNRVHVSNLAKTVYESEDAKKVFDAAKDLVLMGKEQSSEERKQALRNILESGQHVVTTAAKTEDADKLINSSKEVIENVRAQVNARSDVKDGKAAWATAKSVVENTLGEGGKVVVLLKENEQLRSIATHTKQVVSEIQSSEQLRKMLEENKEFLDDVKEVVIPFLRDQILKLRIPVITGTKETKMGKIEFELADIILSSLEVPAEGVNVSFDKDGMAAGITNASAVIKKVNWKYKVGRWPYPSDSGAAFAAISGVSFVVSLNISVPEEKELAPSVQVCGFAVSLLGIDLKVSENRVSWIYNKLLASFKDSIKTSVETKLMNVLKLSGGVIEGKVNELFKLYWDAMLSASKEGDEIKELPLPEIPCLGGDDDTD